MVEIKTLVDQKISEDTEFQSMLETLADEEKEQVITEKREELFAAEFAKAEELANNQKIRAEKAEALAKQLKIQPIKKEESELPKKSESEYSLKDIRALNDVHDDDVDRLVNYAKFMNITIAEAKKLPEMISFMNTSEEFRKTAQANNTGGGKKGTSKDTHEAILERAEAGNLPEDDEGIKKLAEARLAQRLANIKT